MDDEDPTKVNAAFNMKNNPLAQGFAIPLDETQNSGHMMQNEQVAPEHSNHREEGLTGGAASFANFANQNPDLTTENPSRTQRGPVQVTGGQPADSRLIDEETRRILEETGGNPLGLSPGDTG